MLFVWALSDVERVRCEWGGGRCEWGGVRGEWGGGRCEWGGVRCEWGGGRGEGRHLSGQPPPFVPHLDL